MRKQTAWYGKQTNPQPRGELLPAALTVFVSQLTTDSQDAAERRRPRLRQRVRPQLPSPGGRTSVRDCAAAHPRARAGTGGAVAAADQGAAGDGSRRSVVEEDALLPGAGVLVGLGGHAGHRRGHRRD